MLQVKDLVKTYTTKAGTVLALDRVSVNFPESGLVFLLGKSGSGKSTLLNVAGGLDVPDSGEVIVKGKSSKDFSKSDFDSYRNTYVGFIFQEYNILNELTVAQNVALAVELQGKSPKPGLVEEILKKVDLEGMGGRKPSTLSGGQKQRVAIARALVKNPEIIMADEPTGALDTATGTQVFETLKKLSREKLVLVVSHDRDFAESYADRIIELKDGKIVSDRTRVGETKRAVSNLNELSEKKLSIACGAAITEEDSRKILDFLKKNKGEILISAEKEDVEKEIKEAETGVGSFKETVEELTSREKESAEFIKSKFPLRYALKMGISSLKLKPFRLFLTTLLATIAFIVFGVFSTLVTYDSKKISAKTLQDSTFQAAVVSKLGLRRYGTSPISSMGIHILTSDLERLQTLYPEMGLIPIFDFGFSSLGIYSSTGDYFDGSFYTRLRQIVGFSEASYLEGEDNIELIAGRFPESPTEIVVSKLVMEMFCDIGYKDGNESYPLQSAEELLGKRIIVRGISESFYLTVVGVFDPHEDFSEFEYLKEKSVNAYDPVLDSLQEHYFYSFSSVFFVGEGFYDYFSAFDLSEQDYRAMIDLYGTFTDYREKSEDGRYYRYLFSPLTAQRANLLMYKINEYTIEAESALYRAPYTFLNEIRSDSNEVGEMLSIIGPVAIILAIFSALLLYNFISASINAKRKDIGILRAVGARGIDVFKVFFIEGIVITFFSFLLACGGSYLACFVTNSVMLENGLTSYAFFLFDFINVLFVLGIAALSALFSTALPVALTVRKKPVEAIRET